jgi:TetR/AcrR family transcriptional regulator, cholesterol catabolism regulator
LPFNLPGDDVEKPETSRPEASTMSPRQRQRRERILQSTLDLLKNSEKNVEVRDIVDAADVSLATVYRYFGSKEVLFTEVYLHWRALHHDKVLNAIAKGRSDGERLHLAVRKFIEPYKDFPQMFDITNETRTSQLPEIIELRRENELQTIKLFSDVMRDIDKEDALGIVMILIAVAALYLSAWRAGSISFEEVEQSIDRSIRLTVDIREQA